MEGPTDEDAFRSVMKKLHARQQVVFLVIHGDITADRDVNARNALTAVNQKIKELLVFAEEMGKLESYEK